MFNNTFMRTHTSLLRSWSNQLPAGAGFYSCRLRPLTMEELEAGLDSIHHAPNEGSMIPPAAQKEAADLVAC
jgi:hypothetical protein